MKLWCNKPEINHSQREIIVSSEISRIRYEEYKLLYYKYKKDDETINILYNTENGIKRYTLLEPKYYNHIFEYIYKVLKHLFTSNKKLSNDYDNVISRLDKLEEQLNILENENKYLKEKLYDII